MSDERLRERLIDRQEKHRGSYLTFRVDTVEDSDGGSHQREVVVHPGGVAIVALLDGGDVLLVRQYRHAVGEVCLELPAGTLDRDDGGVTEAPELAAPRELEEETGHRAASWHSLGSFFTAPGFATEVMHLYLATGLTAVEGYAGPETDERLDLVRLPWEDAIDLAERGELRDAKTLAGLLRVGALVRRGELPELAAITAR